MQPFHFKPSQAVDLTSLCIKGERLKLRAIDERDAPAIFQEFTAAVTRYMVPRPPETIAETLDFIRRSRQGMAAGWNLVLAILDGKTDEFLGVCGYHGEGQPRTPELGIWLKQAAHGHGYGREAMWTLVAWATDVMDFDDLIYPVDRANLASRKIPESLGGTIFAEKQVETMSGGMLDEVVYQIPYAVAREKITTN